MTRLSLACFVRNPLNIDVFCSPTKRSVKRYVKFGGRFFQTKLLLRLSHKVICRRLSSPVRLRKFTVSEFTQQDVRKKRTAKRLCVTNVTGLLLACFVVIFT